MDKYNQLFGNYNPLIMDKEQRALLHTLQTERFEECLDEYEPRKQSDFPSVNLDWNSSDEKIQRHLYTNPQLFDLLTDEQKKNDNFVNAYRAGIFHQVNSGMEGNFLPNGKIISTYSYNPECTKFYSVEGYQAAMESILNQPSNIFLPSYTKDIIEYEKVPAEVVYVATMREEHPELALELDKAERRAFETVHHQIAEYLWGGIKESEFVNAHYADIVDEKISEFIAHQNIQPIETEWLANADPLLFNQFNMYILNKEQIETLCQLQINNYYTKSHEIISITPPAGHAQYNTAAEVIRAIEQKESQSDYIWGSLSPELKKDKDEMLLLTTKYPGALFQANPSILTVGYLKEAMLRNPHVYDILPDFMQKENDIINTYRTALLNQTNWPKYLIEDSSPQYAIQEFNPSPDCPPDKLYSPEAYKEVFECILTHSNMPLTGCIRMPNYPNEIGAALTYVSNARTMFPELAKEFDKAEIAAFYEVEAELIARCASSLEDKGYVCEFLKHHNIDTKQWLKHVNDEWCKNVAYEITQCAKENNYYMIEKVMNDVKMLMDNVSYYDIDAQFDLEEFWLKCGKESVRDEDIAQVLNSLTSKDDKANLFIKKHFEKGRELEMTKQQTIDIERP